MKDWIYTKLVESAPGKFDVVTNPLGFPVDFLARKAMNLPDEGFAGLPLSEAIKQGEKFERWRRENEAGRRRKK